MPKLRGGSERILSYLPREMTGNDWKNQQERRTKTAGVSYRLRLVTSFSTPSYILSRNVSAAFYNTQVAAWTFGRHDGRSHHKFSTPYEHLENVVGIGFNLL